MPLAAPPDPHFSQRPCCERRSASACTAAGAAADGDRAAWSRALGTLHGALGHPWSRRGDLELRWPACPAADHEAERHQQGQEQQGLGALGPQGAPDAAAAARWDRAVREGALRDSVAATGGVRR